MFHDMFRSLVSFDLIILVISTNVQNFTKPPYETYNLEEICLRSPSETAYIKIDPWEAAILQLGYKNDSNGNPLSRSIHECDVHIETSNNFFLTATIENMKIRGHKSKSTNKWQCSDYIIFSSPKKNIFNKVLKILSFELSSKKSEKLCGETELTPDNLDNIKDVTTQANSFSSSKNKLDLYFHQEDDERRYTNNSFKIIITTFRRPSEHVFARECEGKQKCYGRDIVCIDKSFVCDGHVNCAFPGSGTDEKLCKVLGEKPGVFDTTSVIIIILTSIVSLGILLCIVSSIKNRMVAGSVSRRQPGGGPVSAHYIPSAPQTQNEAPLPPYESVVFTDLAEDKIGLDNTEAPPKYESLFPDSIANPPSAGSLKDGNDNVTIT